MDQENAPAQRPPRVISDPAELAMCERLEVVARDIIKRNAHLFTADELAAVGVGPARNAPPSDPPLQRRKEGARLRARGQDENLESVTTVTLR